jgi:hypothetical protein
MIKAENSTINIIQKTCSQPTNITYTINPVILNYTLFDPKLNKIYDNLKVVRMMYYLKKIVNDYQNNYTNILVSMQKLRIVNSSIIAAR